MSDSELPDDIRLRHFELADLDAVFALHGEVFGEASRAQLERRFHWQFTEHPLAAEIAAPHFVADRAGELVGYIATFPQLFKVFESRVPIRYGADFMVSPSVRRQGVGQALRRRRARETGTPFRISVNMAEAAVRLTLRDASARAARLTPVLLQARSRSGLAFALGASALGRHPGGALLARAVAWPGIALRRRPPVPDAPGILVETVADVGAEFDELWREISPGFPITGVRDAHFVRWRFLDDPLFANTLLAARDGGGRLRGYLALRSNERWGVRAGIILDLFCDPGDTRVVDGLLGAALRQFDAEGVDLLVSLGLHPELRRQVGRHLPLAPRSLDRTMIVHWTGNEGFRKRLMDASGWHLSYADGDLGFAP